MSRHSRLKWGEGAPEALSYYHQSGEMAEVLQGCTRKIQAAKSIGGPLSDSGPEVSYAIASRRSVGLFLKLIKQLLILPRTLHTSDSLPIAHRMLDRFLEMRDLHLLMSLISYFDFMLIDAFSSDSIPVHLMTLEALNLYFSKLAPNGLLAMHISNRHLELESILAAIAEQEGLAIRSAQFERDKTERARQIFPAKTVVLARTDEQLGPLSSDPRWDKVDFRWNAALDRRLLRCYRGDPTASAAKPRPFLI
jgi:hypothetical protein